MLFSFRRRAAGLAVVFFLGIVAFFLPSTVLAYSVGEADLKIEGQASETYDSNVTYSDNRTDDLVTNLNFSADLLYEGKLQNLKLSGQVEHHLFADNGSFDNTAEYLTVDYRRELDKHNRVSLHDVFSHAEEPRSFEDEFGRDQGRYGYYHNALDVDFTHDFSSQLNARLYYSNDFHEVSSPTIDDSVLHTAGFEAGYGTSSKLTFFAGYEFLDRSFDDGGDSMTHSVLGGFRYFFTPKLSLDARAGADFIESFSGNDFTEPVILAALVHEWSQTTSARLSFSERYSTTTYAQDLFDQWRVSGAVFHELNKRCRVSGSVFYGEGEYVAEGRTEKLQGVGAALEYDILKNVKGSVDYSYSHNDSSSAGGDYARHAVTGGVKVVWG